MKKFFLLILAALILIPTVFSSGITSNAAAKKHTAGFVKEKNGTCRIHMENFDTCFLPTFPKPTISSTSFI